LRALFAEGNVIARVVDNVRPSTLVAFVNEAVSEKVGLLSTDQWIDYKGLDKTYPHPTVDHAEHHYFVGAVHTPTIEGFWSIFKRGIAGSFHTLRLNLRESREEPPRTVNPSLGQAHAPSGKQHAILDLVRNRVVVVPPRFFAGGARRLGEIQLLALGRRGPLGDPERVMVEQA
jgi:hypothetical protein